MNGEDRHLGNREVGMRSFSLSWEGFPRSLALTEWNQNRETASYKTWMWHEITRVTAARGLPLYGIT